jgi:hypothetical protein
MPRSLGGQNNNFASLEKRFRHVGKEAFVTKGKLRSNLDRP